jgi:hypothetical protein
LEVKVATEVFMLSGQTEQSRKNGPKAAHKLTEEVLQYFQQQVAAQPELKAEELARRVRQRYGVKLHPRTIQKALKARAKRGRRT